MTAALTRAFAAPEILRVKLQVVAHNHGARQLYRDLGFTETGCEPEAYRDGDRAFDLIDMTLARPRVLLA